MHGCLKWVARGSKITLSLDVVVLSLYCLKILNSKTHTHNVTSSPFKSVNHFSTDCLCTPRRLREYFKRYIPNFYWFDIYEKNGPRIFDLKFPNSRWKPNLSKTRFQSENAFSERVNTRKTRSRPHLRPRTQVQRSPCLFFSDWLNKKIKKYSLPPGVNDDFITDPRWFAFFFVSFCRSNQVETQVSFKNVVFFKRFAHGLIFVCCFAGRFWQPIRAYFLRYVLLVCM